MLEEGDSAGYHACVLGLRDYVDKNRFPSIVLGLSGGIDSALVVAMATDALGPDRVRAVMLPYRYTSSDSLDDAAACAKALGVRYDSVPIAPAVDGFYAMLAPIFANRAPDTTEENVQSRARGTTLMAISNKDGSMLLTTGNKSEMSVGYATIYGDMNGGFNPIKDLYKMEVYRLSRWRNANVPRGGKGPAGVVIPERILTKAPSAELRENQTDQDSLPPYEVLDDILNCLVENEMPLPEIIARGHPPETVKRIERLLYLAEYKRRQAAPGVKISSRSFGRDRRYPITNRFREDPTANRAGRSQPTRAAARATPRRRRGCFVIFHSAQHLSEGGHASAMFGRKRRTPRNCAALGSATRRDWDLHELHLRHGRPDRRPARNKPGRSLHHRAHEACDTRSMGTDMPLQPNRAR